MRESTVERKLREATEARGGFAYKFTAWKGVPDRLIVLPNGAMGFAETKKPKGGKLSELQRYRIEQLIDLNHVVGVVWDVEDIDPFLDQVENFEPATAEWVLRR